MGKNTTTIGAILGLTAVAVIGSAIFGGDARYAPMRHQASNTPARFGLLAPTGSGQFGRHAYSWRIQNTAAVFVFTPPIGVVTSTDEPLVIPAARHVLEREFGLRTIGAPTHIGAFLKFPTTAGDFVVMPIAETDGAIHGLGFSRRQIKQSTQ